MRKQLVEKKLVLKKETVSHLDNSAMDMAKGGGDKQWWTLYSFCVCTVRFEEPTTRPPKQ